MQYNIDTKHVLSRYFILDTREQSFYRHPREASCALIKERRTIYRSLKSNQTARDKLPSRERNDKLERSYSEFPKGILTPLSIVREYR